MRFFFVRILMIYLIECVIFFLCLFFIGSILFSLKAHTEPESNKEIKKMDINNFEQMAKYLRQHGKIDFSPSGSTDSWLVLATNYSTTFSLRKLPSRPGYYRIRLRKDR